MKKIAIIPARSGSKGLKDKNIKELCGQPMMNYSIEAAIETGCFERVIVSTDSEKYGKIAKNAGAEVVYRGEESSKDTASTYMVLDELFKKIEIDFDYFVLLQPTSPLRDSNHIKEALLLYEDKIDKYDFLVSMKESEHTKELVNPIDEDGSLKYFNADFANYRRQEFKYYSPNGAIFIGKPDKYLNNKHFFGERAIGYIMSARDSVDIDTELDFIFAEICMKKKLEGLY